MKRLQRLARAARLRRGCGGRDLREADQGGGQAGPAGARPRRRRDRWPAHVGCTARRLTPRARCRPSGETTTSGSTTRDDRPRCGADRRPLQTRRVRADDLGRRDRRPRSRGSTAELLVVCLLGLARRRHRHLRPAQHPAARLRSPASPEPGGAARLRLDLRAGSPGGLFTERPGRDLRLFGLAGVGHDRGWRSSTARRSAAGVIVAWGCAACARRRRRPAARRCDRPHRRLRRPDRVRPHRRPADPHVPRGERTTAPDVA